LGLLKKFIEKVLKLNMNCNKSVSNPIVLTNYYDLNKLYQMAFRKVLTDEDIAKKLFESDDEGDFIDVFEDNQEIQYLLESEDSESEESQSITDNNIISENTKSTEGIRFQETEAINVNNNWNAILVDSQNLVSTDNINICDESDESDKYVSNKGFIWYKNPSRAQRHRTLQQNILSEASGLRNEAKNIKTIMDSFELFINERIIRIITLHTNEEICRNKSKYKSFENSEGFIGFTNESEIKAVLGLLLAAGLYGSGRTNLSDLWKSNGFGIPIFKLVMSQRRFEFLICCLRFDDKNT